MPASVKTIKAQLALLKPLLSACSLDTIRKSQNKLGEIMSAAHKKEVIIKDHPFSGFSGAWVIPRDERRQGVILYLHGGGYTCGNLDYAKGVGSTLADRCGARVFCAAYRLAPEHRYPAALEDVLEAYRYLLSKGYGPQRITLCGESAGGGLCYVLCMRLRELGLPMPAGIIGISPWTDLTASGESYGINREADPSMSAEVLSFFAGCYTDDRQDPMVSPLFGDLTGMPPSLLFVGGDEIMRSDTEALHQKLLESGCQCSMTVAPGLWHAYLLYHIPEAEDGFAQIGEFLNHVMSEENRLRWMRLDNAAKIYPAARRQNWSNLFRVSVTLKEPVDTAVLQSALDVTARRFPSIATRLRRGVFWYYLQQISRAPSIREEKSYPLTRMSRDETRQCAFRVIVYGRRIALEIFHSLTDGTGAMIFLKSLTAEYLQQKYGVSIPAENGVLGRLEEPTEEELEDSFQKYAGKISASRRENNAWQLSGTPEPSEFVHLTCFRLCAGDVIQKAHEYHVSATAFLAAAMMMAIQNLQEDKVPNPKRRKHIRVQIPVNLRRIFPSETLRNFALYSTPEIDPRVGRYSFEEICKVVHHQMGIDINAKVMSTKIAANVSSERMLVVKLMPLFLKNIVMRIVFDAVGERKSCLSISNLGVVKLPDEMVPYVERMDFILGTQATAPHNCGVVTFGDQLCINFVRNIREPELEAHFYRVLRELELHVEVQSNRPER